MRASFSFNKPINFRYDTNDGGTVECIRVGVGYELIVRNAAGHCTATVRMDEGEFLGLRSDMAAAA